MTEITLKEWREMTRRDAVCARIRRPADRQGAYIEVKRGKHKHWHIIGFHEETDLAFRRALQSGSVIWRPEIVEDGHLF